MRVLNWPGCVALALVFGCSSPDRQTGATNPTDDDGPILIASSNGSLRLTADESRAYWAVANGGGIWGADLDGTEQWEVASLQGQVLDIRADDQEVFCIEYDPILEGAAPFTSLVELVTVVRLAEGSDPEELHVSEGYPGGLALGGNQVVLAMTRSEGETENTGNIVAISRSDGATTSLGSQLPFPATPVVRDSTVYWINQGTTAGFGRFENGSIQSVPVGGGSSTTLGAGITTLAAFAVGESLYFTSVVEMQATLFSCPLAGCGEGNADATVVTSRTMEEERPPWCYAADERGLYVSEYAEPETDILWIAAGQAEPIVLASDRDCPRQIAVNSSSVLWVEQCEDSSEWTIWRMPR